MLVRCGRSPDHLALAQNYLPLALPAVQRQYSGFSAEADNLQDFAEAEVFQISNKAHIDRTLTLPEYG
jgi:hypothetical protein